jgi:hypothetical protein
MVGSVSNLDRVLLVRFAALERAGNVGLRVSHRGQRENN